MHDRIDVYIKHPAHNWRGYSWVYMWSTRMHKTCKEAQRHYSEQDGIALDWTALKQRRHKMQQSTLIKTSKTTKG